MPRKPFEELLSSVCRFADAVGFPRGGSLASLPPDLKLSELYRILLELNDIIYDQLTSNTPDCLVAMINTPQARVALIQLHAAALRLVTDPWDRHSLDAAAASASLGTPAVLQASSSAAGKERSARAASSNTRGAGRIGTGAASNADAKAEDGLAVLVEASKLHSYYLCFLYNVRLAPGMAGWYRNSAAELMREHSSALLQVQTIPALTRFLVTAAADERSGSTPYSSNTRTSLTDMLFEGTVQVYNVLRNLLTAADCDGTLRAELMDSFSSSGLLEHMAKDGAPRAAAAAAPAARPPGFRATDGGGSDGANGVVTYNLPRVLLGIMSHLGHRPAPPPSLRSVLSGPCLQYFAAAQAVSQLHAADGGPLYGLPYDALLPEVQEPEQDGNRIPRPRRQQQEGSPVNSMPVGRAVSFWQACLAHEPPVPLQPLRRRHLVALCLRAARVALDSMDVHEGQQGQQQRQEQPHHQQRRTGPLGNSGGPAGTGSGGELRLGVGLRRPFEEEGCGALALDALETVVTVHSSRRSSSNDGGEDTDPRLHHAPSAARWWPMVVRCTRTMLCKQQQLRQATLSGRAWSPELKRCCAMLQLDGHADEGALSGWPTDSCHNTAPAGLPHALSAGYIPTYEALLRTACRSADLSLPASTTSGSARENVTVAVAARKATRLLRSLLLVAPGSKLLLLLGEGHPREAAALATTLCKAHLQHAQLAEWLGSREGLAEAAGMVTGLSRVFRTGMTAQAGGAAAVSIATSSRSDSSSSGNDGGGEPSSSSGGGGSDSVVSGSSDRVFAVSGQRVYPVDVGSSSKQRLLLLSHMLPRLLPVMTHIGALCFAGGLGGTAELEELAIARHQLLQFAANGEKVVMHSTDSQAVKNSWLQLERDTIVADLVGPGGVVAAMSAAQRARKDAGGPGGEAEGKPRGDSECGQSGLEDEEDEEDDEGEVEGQQQQQWVKLVPHAPCVAAQLLRTCSNPLCVNMEGDSEASVVLGVAEAGSGGRALASPLGVGGEAKRFCSAGCRDSQQEQLRRLRVWERADVDCRNCRWCCAMRGEHTRG